MKQHSDDYKLSAVMYYINHNEDLRDTCDIFKCKYQSLHRWIKRYKLQGNISRKTRKNHNLKITSEIEKFIKEHVHKYSTTTLWELSKLVNEKFKIHLTDSSIYKRTICLDETSIYLNMKPSYGRSKSGTRVIKKTNIYPFKRYNMLCAICANKVVGWKLYKDIKGVLKTQNILDFYDEFIKDNYKNYLIIMDNAVIHKSKMIREKIEDNHNYLLYSVPYHPETNSIEEFFSQLKHYIKKESPNTYEDIDTTIKDVLANKIKKEHLTNYLKHSYKIYK
jgi:transposase